MNLNSEVKIIITGLLHYQETNAVFHELEPLG